MSRVGRASLLLVGLMIAGCSQPEPGGLTGWTIIRTPDGLRLQVPVEWAVDVAPAGTTFASSAEALGSPGAVLAGQAFRALIVSGSIEELPLPSRTERSEVAVALAGDREHRGVSIRGAASDGQTILVVKEVAPGLYAGVSASAAAGPDFPHQRELEDIVLNLDYRAVEAGGSAGSMEFWLEHVQDIRRFEREPRLWYDLLVPGDDAEAPESGWPVLVLAHAATLSYASIAEDGLAVVVVPHFTWNAFEEDRQILDAILADVGANHPLDDRRLIMHGCSVGGRFTFQYTLAEPNRVAAAVPMAAFDLRVPPSEVWHIPFVFFWGDQDPLYDAEARAAIEGMQAKMDSVELYLDAGRGHVCDPVLAVEAIRRLLAAGGSS